ncbi:MAG: YceI family protein [Rhodothermales bacterium]
MKTQTYILSLLLLAFVFAGFTLTGNQAEETPTQPTASADVSNWRIDPVHSKIGFKARHFGISIVRGEFKDFEASFRFDPEDLSTVEASVRIRAASVFTGTERRDNHLRSDDFFNAEVDSIITFTSKRVQNIDGSKFELVGDLTIRGNTHEVVLDAEFLGTISMDRRGEIQVRGAFEAETKVNRKEYGLKFDRTAGGAAELIVGEEVTLIIELELIKMGA